ncbi:MAG TPA: nitroreductase family protein [Rubrobacteraceae bacterium]|nr:nitroreductase family protein [Rubrobacteraceae bacterium]
MTDTSEGRAKRDRIRFLRSLRAVRSFGDDPVPQEVIDDILEVARWSGSASNRQPWEILLVRDRETLRALANVEGYAGHLDGAPLGIVLVMQGERPEQETYDEGRLAERIMLAASAHGVGSSIGWIVGSGRDAAKDLLGVPPGRVVRTALSLGYPDESSRRPRTSRGQARKPLSEIVHEERYGQAPEPERSTG